MDKETKEAIDSISKSIRKLMDKGIPVPYFRDLKSKEDSNWIDYGETKGNTK